MSLSSNFPTIKPSLNLDFANVGALDPRITFTRATTATYTNSLGLIATAASGVARFDYNPTTLAPLGLLIEEARTNIVLYSEQFDNAAWTKGDTTVTANAIAAPDGTVTADKLNETATTAIHQLYSSISASAQSYTWSVYARAGERTVFSLGFSGATARYAWFDLSSGTLVSATNCTATITNVGNSWYRCTLTATAAAETTYPQIFLGTTASGYAPSYAGTAGSGIYIWGAQLEAGSFATSYIPTVASTVTRNADVASVNTLTPWFNAAEGTVCSECTPIARDGDIAWAFGPYPNGMYSVADNTQQLVVVVGSAIQANLIAGTYSATANNKIAASYKQNDFAVSVNGSAAATDTSGTVPSVSVLVIGGQESNTVNRLNGWVRRFSYYPARLTNAQLQALTS